MTIENFLIRRIALMQTNYKVFTYTPEARLISLKIKTHRETCVARSFSDE